MLADEENGRDGYVVRGRNAAESASLFGAQVFPGGAPKEKALPVFV